MAFPDDYNENKTKCPLDSRGGQHNWSTMGHPIGHRCNNCHDRKWIPKPVEAKPDYSMPINFAPFHS